MTKPRNPHLLVALVCCALSACDLGDSKCSSALELRIDLPCCDAYNASVWVEFADGRTSQLLIDYAKTMNGGIINVAVPYPAMVVRGTASVTFAAWGDGTQSFSATGAVDIVPTECAQLELSVRKTDGQPDAGP